jgi:hypothetical protein
LFIHREKKAFAIFVRSALKGQGEMAAANLCMIGKLVYGEIIRKIALRMLGVTAAAGGVILKGLSCGNFKL